MNETIILKEVFGEELVHAAIGDIAYSNLKNLSVLVRSRFLFIRCLELKYPRFNAFYGQNLEFINDFIFNIRNLDKTSFQIYNILELKYNQLKNIAIFGVELSFEPSNYCIFITLSDKSTFRLELDHLKTKKVSESELSYLRENLPEIKKILKRFQIKIEK